MIRRWLALAFVVVALLLVSRGARADQSAAHSVSVAVLALDSDDAEEQADALTAALRSRVRKAEGWSLIETSQSLGMLTAALRCPAKPMTADCEQRIADQLKTDRYMFGYVSRGPQPGQVTAELHLWQRNRADVVRRETYSDNLRDGNDEALQKVAQGLLEAVGASAVGTLVVRMGNENGEVVIDGDKRVPLQNGNARLELAPGTHSVEVVLVGAAAQKRNVLVQPGKESVVTLGVPAASAKARADDKPFPVRKVVGGGLAAVGVAAGVIAVLNFVAYQDAVDKGNKIQASTNPADIKLPPGKTADDACGRDGFDARNAICVANADANRSSTIAWVGGAASVVLLGAGAYFLLTDSASDKEKRATRGPKVVPTVGVSGGGLLLSGSF